MSDIIRIAENLVSEEGENPEYDRAITELTCEVLGIHMDHKEAVGLIIGVQPQSIAQWGKHWSPDRFQVTMLRRFAVGEHDGFGDPRLNHDPCGQAACTIEQGDDLSLLVRTALGHAEGCPA